MRQYKVDLTLVLCGLKLSHALISNIMKQTPDFMDRHYIAYNCQLSFIICTCWLFVYRTNLIFSLVLSVKAPLKQKIS
jgi:hypothetical protein